MPVVGEEGVTCGECPYCSSFIPEQPQNGFGEMDPSQNARIL